MIFVMRAFPLAIALVFLLAFGLDAQMLAGTVRIERQPADPGTYVQLVVYRANRSFTVCGDTTVTKPGGTYRLLVYQTPECRTPGDTYELYVNGIWAASRASASALPSQMVPADLNVPLAALKTSLKQSGVRLVWFYGTVTDALNRPAAPGLRIMASVGAPFGTTACTGIGPTQDVYWTPTTPGAQPVNVKGFYLIAVEIDPKCQDKPITFALNSLGSSSQGRVITADAVVNTPPYGVANRRNLVLKN
jgi:hypothetical protein